MSADLSGPAWMMAEGLVGVGGIRRRELDDQVKVCGSHQQARGLLADMLASLAKTLRSVCGAGLLFLELHCPTRKLLSASGTADVLCTQMYCAGCTLDSEDLV